MQVLGPSLRSRSGMYTSTVYSVDKTALCCSSGYWGPRIFPLLESKQRAKFWILLHYPVIRYLQSGGVLMASVLIKNGDVAVWGIEQI